jgi:hypothetical protein
MAKIVRYGGNLQAFASAALGTERTIFGDVTQANDLTSQINADFLRGWGIVGPSDQPALEDFNGAMYTHGQLLAYLHQIGIAEYNSTQEYHLGSLCNVAGMVYSSLINTNVGNPPASSPTQWRELYAQATELIRGSAAVATQALAEAGVDDLTMMTPLKTKQAISAQVSTDGIVGSHSNLKISTTGTSAPVTITADSVCVKNATFGQKVLNAVSLSANLAVSGVNGLDTGTSAASTWYSVWVIWNGTTTASLLSLSATAPTMPGGYTHKARIGWIRSDASVNKFPLSYNQTGNRAQYKVVAGSNVTAKPTMASATADIVETAVSVVNFVPPSAASISTVVTLSTGGVSFSVYVGPAVGDTISSGLATTSSQPVQYFQTDILLQTTSIGWNVNASSTGNAVLACDGWVDNL